MASIEQRVRERSVGDTLEEVIEALDREVMPVLSSGREEINLLGGNTVSIGDDDEYEIEFTAGVVICSNTGAITIYLPNASDVPDKHIHVVSTDANVTVTGGRSGAGGLIGASATALLSSGGYLAQEYLSDGSIWHILSSHS